MTSPENYQKILESGVLKSMGGRLPDGVYMLELDSFGKYWSKNLRNDLCDKKVNVNLPGGVLTIEWAGNSKNTDFDVFMTGEAQYVYTGVIDI